MGKRSDFERKARDFYPTPRQAVIPLIPYLSERNLYIEPCAGDGALVSHLWDFDIKCLDSFDIDPKRDWIRKKDALEITQKDLKHADTIITNPPWDRKILHPMIEYFRKLAPTWLLFDADWMHTKQSSEYMKYCKKIVSVGRLKWIPDSKMTGKDNCAWYLFTNNESPTEFIGR